MYDDPTADPKNVKTLILCSGKLYYELLERKEKVVADDVALVRIEQLHPLPEPQLEAVFARYANVEEVRWVQEEPENMGAWPYIFKHLHKVNGAPSVEALKSVARRASGAPATGSGVRSALQQQRILEDAFAGRSSAPVAKKANTKVRA